MGLLDLTDLVVKRGLEGASLRQEVISNNLANANTPGFRRSDVDFSSSLAAALGSSDPTAAVQNLSFAPQTDTTSAVQADGNNVDMDTEMASLTSNAVEYQTLAEIEKTRMGMLSSAIGGS
jgi:flagellar basal-body rod protein FlgB